MEVARANNGRWQSGQSGNPSGLPGRPLGSRAAFSQGFTRDLAEVWQARGKQAMNWTADNQPAVFFATCARLLPNDVRVTVEQQNRHHPPGRFITCTALTFLVIWGV